MKTREDIINEIAKQEGLRTYQKECAGKVMTCFFETYNKEFLISACCRYGKTTTALTICKMITEVLNEDDAVICVVSGLPGSVKSSWRDDAYRLGFIKDRSEAELSLDSVDFTQTEGVQVTFISTQKLGDNTTKEGDLVEHSGIKEYKDFFNNHKGVKLIITDEAHNGFGTDRILDALSGLKYDYKMELTATPFTMDLIKKYKLDTTQGDDRSYFFSQVDMLKLYNSAAEIILDNGTVAREGFTYVDKATGETKGWRPVQPVIIVEDIYQKLLDKGFDFDSCSKEFNSTAFVTVYFKVLFTNPKCDKYCREFIETYILKFAEDHNITNFLAYVTSNDIANRMAYYINKHYGDKVLAKSLADQTTGTDESSTDRANKYFEQQDGKIHFIITCRKCGTGSSMPRLEASMFAKGVTSYIELCQFGARPYTPCESKEFGYTIMFSPIEALQMIAQSANGQKKSLDPAPNAGNIDDYLPYIKVFLDGEQLLDATDVINKLDTIYRPYQTKLFPSLDLLDPEIYDELTGLVKGSAIFRPRKPQTPKDVDSEDTSTGSMNQGIDTNDNSGGASGGQRADPDKNEKPTQESIQEAFQTNFVETIIAFCQDGFSEDDIRNIDENSTEIDKEFITTNLCSMKLWNKLREEYFDKVLHKVYVYATKRKEN